VFCQGGESSDVTARSPTTGSGNGDCTTSGLAKFIADISVNLRTQLTRFSVCWTLAFYDRRRDSAAPVLMTTADISAKIEEM